MENDADESRWPSQTICLRTYKMTYENAMYGDKLQKDQLCCM